jgi:[ribosomal protein S5]-alanine N-acetyltransferase
MSARSVPYNSPSVLAVARGGVTGYHEINSMTPELETSRLYLRPLSLGDADQLQRIFPQWEIVRWLANKVPWPYPPDGAITYIRDIALPAEERGEAWHWTLRLKTDPARIIGAIDLRKGETENRGFWLAPPWQGQGLMTEACEVVTDFWFHTLKMPVLRAPKAVLNVGSRRISEKQGMRLIATEERDYVSGRFPSEIWEITAEEWRARKRQT